MSEAEQLITTETDGAVMTVTLNRPAKANALNQVMLRRLAEIFEQAGDNTELRALVITAAGEGAFCAGADLKELGTLTGRAQGVDDDIWTRMASALRALPVLTIAAMNGTCMGGGLTLALGCDIRLAVSAARFQYPVLKNNVLPAQYDVDSLLRLIGPGRTSALLLGGDKLSAEEALQWGLVDRLVDRAGLMSAARDLVKTAAGSDPDHLAALKSLIREAQS